MWQNVASLKVFILQREPNAYVDCDNWLFEFVLRKSRAIIEPIQSYIQPFILQDYAYSLALHYFIAEPFTYESEGETLTNPLYTKFDMANKESGMIVNSASDESSSASMESIKSLQEGDFLMADLMRTRYGLWVYQLIESLDIGGIRL